MIGECRECDAEGVTDEVDPEKTMAKDQRAKTMGPGFDQERMAAELTALDGEAKGEGDDHQQMKREAGKHGREAPVDHRRPQSISSVITDH